MLWRSSTSDSHSGSWVVWIQVSLRAGTSLNLNSQRYQVADLGYYYVGQKSELSQNSWRSRSRTSNRRDLASTCVLRPRLEELVSLNFRGTDVWSKRQMGLRNELQYTNWGNY